MWKWLWRTYLVRRFDPKRAQYNEFIQDAKWYEDRAVKLGTLREQLTYGKMYGQPPDLFKRAEMISKLDPNDAEWARKVEDVALLIEASKNKQEECLNNAQQCRQLADEVGQKVLFW